MLFDQLFGLKGKWNQNIRRPNNAELRALKLQFGTQICTRLHQYFEIQSCLTICTYLHFHLGKQILITIQKKIKDCSRHSKVELGIHIIAAFTHYRMLYSHYITMIKSVNIQSLNGFTNEKMRTNTHRPAQKADLSFVLLGFCAINFITQ